MNRLDAIVHGHVQGVFFRQTAIREAKALGLTGWVRNEPDGTVRTVAEGNDPALEQYLAFLHDGPPEARVTNVDERWSEASGKYADFTARF